MELDWMAGCGFSSEAAAHSFNIKKSKTSVCLDAHKADVPSVPQCPPVSPSVTPHWKVIFLDQLVEIVCVTPAGGSSDLCELNPRGLCVFVKSVANQRSERQILMRSLKVRIVQ